MSETMKASAPPEKSGAMAEVVEIIKTIIYALLIALFLRVLVDYYGSPTPLAQLAGLQNPEARVLLVTPYDKSALKEIEKAIVNMPNLSANVGNDGEIVRVTLPELTEDRRKELSKIVHKYAEEGRNGVRQVRRDANEKLKKLLKDHKISEDEERKGLDEVQKLSDQHVHLIDDIQKKKDSELLGK